MDAAQVTKNVIDNKEQKYSKSFAAAVRNLHEITSFQHGPSKVQEAHYSYLKLQIRNSQNLGPESFLNNLNSAQHFVDPQALTLQEQ